MADGKKTIVKASGDQDAPLEPGDMLNPDALENELEKRKEPKTVETPRELVEETRALLGTVFELPLDDLDGAKEALKRVKEMLEVSDLTEKEEDQLWKFLHEVEKLYPDTSELDGLISEIQKTLEEKGEIEKEPEEEKEEEPKTTKIPLKEGEGYIAVTKVPEVPVEERRPTPPIKAEESKSAEGLGKLGDVIGAKLKAVKTVAPKPKPEAPTPPAKEAPPKTTEEKKAVPAENLDQAVDRLYKPLTRNLDFKALIRMIRLLKADPKTDVPDDERATYERALNEFFATNDVHVIRTKLGADKSLAFIREPALLRDNGLVNKKLVLRRLLETLGDKRTLEAVVVAVAVLRRKLQDYAAAESQPKTTPPEAPTEATAAAPAEKKMPKTIREAQMMAFEEYMRERNPDLVVSPEELENLFNINRLQAKGELKEGMEKAREAFLKANKKAKRKAKEEADRRAVEEDEKVAQEKAAAEAQAEPKAAEEEAPPAERSPHSGEVPPEPEPTPEPEPEPTPEPEAAPERSEMPEFMAATIAAVAEGDEKKKERLYDLWEVHQGKAKLADDADTKKVKKLMENARRFAEKGRPDFAKVPLLAALEIKGEIIRIDKPSPEPPPKPPKEGGGRGAPSGGEAPSGGGAPAPTPTPEPEPEPEPTPEEAPETKGKKEEKKKASKEAEKEAVKYLGEQEKSEFIDSLMKRLGQPMKDDKPVVAAIKSVLMDNIKTEADIKKLEIFLKSGEYGDEVDKLAQSNTPQKLQKKLAKLIGKIGALEARIYQNKKALRKETDPRVIKKITKKVGKMEAEKSQLLNKKTDITQALERQKQEKTKETIYYSNKPEKLLGMINLHFEKKGLEKGETPNYEEVLEATHKQIEDAMKNSSWVTKALKFSYKTLAFPASFLKPTLKGTLQAVVEKDKALQKVKPEQAAELAKLWNDPKGVENWINSLEGSEQEKMKTIVPALIGHLSEAVNIGGWSSYMNNISIYQSRGLLKQLRSRVHKYSMESAETTKGSSLDRMGAYFGQLNQVNRKADEVKRNIVKSNMNKVMARNVFIGAGTTVGAVSLAGLSGLALATAGVASVAGGALGSSFRIEDPKIKAFLQKQSVRGLAAGGLGALALGVTPWLAAPLIAGGLFSPELWKNRDKIEAGMVKHGPTVARGGVKVVKGTTYFGFRAGLGVFGTMLGGGILPLISKKYRNLFGIHLDPYLPRLTGTKAK